MTSEIVYIDNCNMEVDEELVSHQAILNSLSATYGGESFTQLKQEVKESSERLTQSCFADIRLEQINFQQFKVEFMEEEEEEEYEDEDFDDELTNLTWLQDQNLLRSIDGHSLCGSPLDDDEMHKENDANNLQLPPHVPYNPQKHVSSKPPYSFSCLIFMAIEDSPDKKLPVKDIYNWILVHFPYFQNAPTGWKNSVRHNLSLNKCFKKVEKDRSSNIGKGSLWMIDPDFRPNLLQALRKTPYHPFHQLQMFNNAQTPMFPSTAKPMPLQNKFNGNTPSPHLFPFLSKRLAQSGCGPMVEDDIMSVSEVDVANTLVALRRAAEDRRQARSPSPPEFGSEEEKAMLKKKRTAVVFTKPPSAEHDYCLTYDIEQSPVSSSIDGEYEFGNDRSRTSRQRGSQHYDTYSESDYEEEGWSEEEELYELQMKQHLQGLDSDEEARVAEGARALLDLAGVQRKNRNNNR